MDFRFQSCYIDSQTKKFKISNRLNYRQDYIPLFYHLLHKITFARCALYFVRILEFSESVYATYIGDGSHII